MMQQRQGEDGFSSGGNGMTKEDMESLKLEMVREMRDMKQSLKDANQSNFSVLQELKNQNQQLIRQQ